MKNNLKKIVAMCLLLALVALPFGVKANAAEETKVYVTIVNGSVVLMQEEITVTDIDGDSALTINDALYCAHAAKFSGGAEGFASSGGFLTKLWGVENGGNYGFYVNNNSAWSLADAVADGDYITAFVYTDLDTWSDRYAFFDANKKTVAANEEFTLTLKIADYAADYSPISVPVANAVITIDGVATEYKTDADGKVTLKLTDAKTCTISATSDTVNLVPPVCVVTATSSPATGDNTPVMVLSALALLCASGIVISRRKEIYE